MAAGIGFDQEPCGFEGACAQLEFLCYCAEPEEFSCRKRKKREESPAFRGTIIYKSNYVLGIELRQEKCAVASVLTTCVAVSLNECRLPPVHRHRCLLFCVSRILSPQAILPTIELFPFSLVHGYNSHEKGAAKCAV